MIDGKVATALSDLTNSFQCCSVYSTTPKIMNDLRNIYKRPVSQNSLNFGLSSLQAWIRCMECFLHILYRIELNIWQARSGEARITLKVEN